ncbi:MAG: hypothetical protein V4450_12535 [Bacteroidota bacterium]
MRLLLLPLFILFSGIAHGQYKTYRISDRGDTLNAIDIKGLKQGRWALKGAALRGQPAYEEEGVFVNDKKEGVWRRFNELGDPVAVETYRWGNKNGICRYFTISGLEREESWRAVSPDKAYDTIDVPDPINPNKFEKVIVKNEGVSMRHGTWKYYSPTGKLVNTESWFLNKLQEPGAEDPTAGLAKVSKDTTKAKPPETTKPKVVLDFEKKTSNKKKAVRDGRTGGG